MGPRALNLAASAAVAGHCFPVGRSGGKGVATSVGQVLATFPVYFPVDAGVAVATAAIPSIRQRTRVGTTVASTVWGRRPRCGGAGCLPNPGGVTPTATLPLAAAVSSAVIAAIRTRCRRRRRLQPLLRRVLRLVIGLVTDSASQIPPELAARLGVEVVPVIVAIDGIEYREGIDLDADAFWNRFSGGALPEVTTSQPPPGAFVETYERLSRAGADEILSVHVGSAHSGTLNSARLAAAEVDVPITLVDTATASFGVACCVWEAATRLAVGATAREAAAHAEAIATTVGTTFVIQALDFARRGGRFDGVLPEEHEGVVVLGGVGGAIDVLATGRTFDEVCDRMVAPFLASGGPIRAGVCLADEATLPFTEAIEARLRDAPVEVELVRYRVGPSIAAHTGPGTAGGFWYPLS
ncbi:MAG: glycerol-3-phosphate acyltransferase [Acidimicrobiales bacterium]